MNAKKNGKYRNRAKTATVGVESLIRTRIAYLVLLGLFDLLRDALGQKRRQIVDDFEQLCAAHARHLEQHLRVRGE